MKNNKWEDRETEVEGRYNPLSAFFLVKAFEEHNNKEIMYITC